LTLNLLLINIKRARNKILKINKVLNIENLINDFKLKIKFNTINNIKINLLIKIVVGDAEPKEKV
jgi:hypothetical protein